VRRWLDAPVFRELRLHQCNALRSLPARRVQTAANAVLAPVTDRYEQSEMTEIPYHGKRIGAGILLLIGLFSLANYYFEWGIFGRFEKAAMIGIFLVSFIYLVRVGPTVEDMLDHRDTKNREKPAPVAFRTRLQDEPGGSGPGELDVRLFSAR